MNGRRTAIGFTLVAAGSLAILWISKLPLGVPGEWEWDRIPVARGEWMAVVLGWLAAGVVGGLYIALALLGARRLEGAPRGVAQKRGLTPYRMDRRSCEPLRARGLSPFLCKAPQPDNFVFREL